MKRVILLTTACAATASVAGPMTVIELGGLEVDGAEPLMIPIFQHTHGPLESIKWWIEYEALTPSWGSELVIELVHHPSGFMFSFDGSDSNFSDLGPNDVLFGWSNTSGVFTAHGDFAFPTPPPFDTYGEWWVTIYDEFDDPGPDGRFLPGSHIIINKVPTPGAAVLLGLAGIAGVRRRR